MDTLTITLPIVKTTKDNRMVFIVAVPNGYALRTKGLEDKEFQTIEISKDLEHLVDLLNQLFKF